MAISVYNGLIKNEKSKPEVPACFLGAWYHKVFSSKDQWLGIEGTITLPKVDIKRFSGNKNLDTPSIYMGGEAKYESDVGLSFTKGLISNNHNNPYFSEGGIVFRPFWRYITDGETDEGGYDFTKKRYYNASNLTPNMETSNCYAHYSPLFTEYYYLPGDKVKMQITYPKKDYMQLRIEVIKVSELESSINTREKYQWKNPKTFISPLFSSPQIDLITFKRVNAIDQSSNEGKPTIMTNTTVLEANWESVYLYRNINDEIFKVPFNNERGSIMSCPDTQGFEITEIGLKDGSSNINLVPSWCCKND